MPCTFYYLRREQLFLFPVPINLMITSLSFGCVAIAKYAQQEDFIKRQALAGTPSNKDLYIVLSINIVAALLTLWTFAPGLWIAIFRPTCRLTNENLIKAWRNLAVVTSLFSLGNVAGLTYVAGWGWTSLGAWRKVDLDEMLAKNGQVGMEYWSTDKVRSTLGLSAAGCFMVGICSTILILSLKKQLAEAKREQAIGGDKLRQSVDSEVASV